MTRTFNHALALVAALFITGLTFAETLHVPAGTQLAANQFVGSGPLA